MKKLLLLIAILLPLTAVAARPAKRAARAEVASIISEFRHYDGVEVVKLGWLATSLVKGLARHADSDDADMRQLLQLVHGLRGVTVIDYDDAEPAVRDRMNRKIGHALRNCELLMEARGDGNALQLFGVVDDARGTVRDLVLHTPDSNALICLSGTLSLDAVGKIMAE